MGNRLGGRVLAVALAVSVVPVAGVAWATPAAATTGLVLVTNTADVIDAGEVGTPFPGETVDTYDPFDGGLSLRERIAAADASPGPDTIELLAGATYVLDRCGTESGGEGALDNSQGDLDVADAAELTIDGNGATIEQTCLEAAGVDGGILSLGSGSESQLQELTLEGGGWGVASLRDLEIVDSLVTGADGAGLRLVGADLIMSGSTVASNVAGVVALDPSESVVRADIERSTVSGNGGDATVVGGLLVEGELSLLSSTVTGNAGLTGGIAADYLYVERSTVAGNVGTEIDEVALGQLSSAGAIVGEGLGESPDCAIEEMVFSAFTLYGDPACQDGAIPPDIPPTGDLVGADPVLGPLADNGGPTSTRLPWFSSPVVDAVAVGCGGTDQRGVARPQGAGCDMGAVERAVSFSDVGWDHQFVADVECLVDLGVTEGFADGTFGPTLPISRQGAVAWLWRLAGEPEPTSGSPFSDVGPGHQFHDAIAWAAAEGVASGFADGTFRPGQAVARQAVAAWLWRLEGEPAAVAPPVFVDVPDGHPFGAAIGWLAEVGVTEGYVDGTFRPTQPIARQGLAAWICRYDELVP